MNIQMNRRMLFIAMLILMLGLSGCFRGSSDKSATDKTVKTAEKSTNQDTQSSQAFQPAIPIQLKDLSGETVSLESYKGKFVLINFWATWCTYCDQEMPDLEALQKKNEDLVILAISVSEDKKTVESYLKEKGIDLKVLLDIDGDVAEAYAVNSMPTSFFVDRNGMVIGFLKGMMTAEDMEKAMTYLREKDTARE